MAYIAPHITDKELNRIIEKTHEKSDLSNLPTFTTESGIVVQKPYTNLLLKVMEKLNLVYGYIDMTLEYDYRPDYVAYDYYGTTNLYWFVLYTNKVSSFLNFTHNQIKKIKIYRENDVFTVLNEIMKE